MSNHAPTPATPTVDAEAVPAPAILAMTVMSVKDAAVARQAFMEARKLIDEALILAKAYDQLLAQRQAFFKDCADIPKLAKPRGKAGAKAKAEAQAAAKASEGSEQAEDNDAEDDAVATLAGE